MCSTVNKRFSIPPLYLGSKICIQDLDRLAKTLGKPKEKIITFPNTNIVQKIIYEKSTTCLN